MSGQKIEYRVAVEKAYLRYIQHKVSWFTTCITLSHEILVILFVYVKTMSICTFHVFNNNY